MAFTPPTFSANSARGYISTDAGVTKYDIGLLRDFVVATTGDNLEIRADNGDNPEGGAEYLTVDFTWLEPKQPLIVSKLFGGAIGYSYTTATPVNVVDESLTLVRGDKVKLANRNGDGTEVTSITVTTDPGGTPLVESTDYVVVISNGDTYIFLLDTYANATEPVLVDYTYTPLEKENLTGGGAAVIKTPFWMQIVTLDEKPTIFTMEKMYATTGMTWQLYDVIKSGDTGVADLSFKTPKGLIWNAEFPV